MLVQPWFTIFLKHAILECASTDYGFYIMWRLLWTKSIWKSQDMRGRRFLVLVSLPWKKEGFYDFVSNKVEKVECLLSVKKQLISTMTYV
jgi:hypothetical protein